jgi:hypothetical protein
VIWTGWREGLYPNRDDAKVVSRFGADIAEKATSRLRDVQKSRRPKWLELDSRQAATMAAHSGLPAPVEQLVDAERALETRNSIGRVGDLNH